MPITTILLFQGRPILDWSNESIPFFLIWNLEHSNIHNHFYVQKYSRKYKSRIKKNSTLHLIYGFHNRIPYLVRRCFPLLCKWHRFIIKYVHFLHSSQKRNFYLYCRAFPLPHFNHQRCLMNSDESWGQKSSFWALCIVFGQLFGPELNLIQNVQELYTLFSQ